MNTQRPAPLASAHGVPGRDEFRLDPTVRHLNHGSFGAVPSRTIDYRARLTERLETNPFRWFDELANWSFAQRQLEARQGGGKGYRYPAMAAAG